MPKKAEEKYTPDAYRLIARPAVKGKFMGAVAKDGDKENTPIVTCRHSHDNAKAAIACMRGVAAANYHFNIIN